MSLLVVDGYNIINSWPELESLRLENMEIARLKLAEMLEEYAALQQQKVVLVFDAYRVKKGVPFAGSFRGVEVVFTREGQTADVFIERLVVLMAEEGYDVEVASSDYLEQRLVLWKGGRRVTSRELRQRIERARREAKKFSLQRTSRNALDERLSKGIKNSLDRWRRS